LRIFFFFVVSTSKDPPLSALPPCCYFADLMQSLTLCFSKSWSLIGVDRALSHDESSLALIRKAFSSGDCHSTFFRVLEKFRKMRSRFFFFPLRLHSTSPRPEELICLARRKFLFSFLVFSLYECSPRSLLETLPFELLPVETSTLDLPGSLRRRFLLSFLEELYLRSLPLIFPPFLDLQSSQTHLRFL